MKTMEKHCTNGVGPFAFEDEPSRFAIETGKAHTRTQYRAGPPHECVEHNSDLVRLLEHTETSGTKQPSEEVEFVT